nr:placenta-specific protein 9 [Camelus dromedarius]
MSLPLDNFPLQVRFITGKSVNTLEVSRRVQGPHCDKTCFPTAAEPFIPSHGDPARATGCDKHMAIHSRLDVLEETVEKTVEHLEAEVKGLLGQLEELAWNLPPGPFSPIPDLLGDGDDRF